MRWSYIGAGTAVTGQFISTWKTDNAGASTSSQIALPLINGKSYNMTVDWGDETTSVITAYNDADATHTYPGPGTYTVTITGTFGGMKFNNGGDRLKILTIAQWGCLDLSTDAVFYGCANLQITAKDTATRTTTSFNDMFRGCSSLAGGLTSVGTTGVQSVSRCFQDCVAFNGDLSSWDASSFVSLLSMFDGCTAFNQSLNSWDTSNVKSLQKTFLNCASFNQPLNSWNVTSVTRFTDAFKGCTAFNQPLSSWNVAAGIYGGNSMFYNCAAFDQDLSSWDVTSWTDFTNMFFGCRLSAANYDALLIAWAALDVVNSKSFHAGSSRYSSGAAEAARQSLIDDDLWTITDGGENAFVFIVETEAESTSVLNKSFRLPLLDAGVYDFVVDWGDGSDPDTVTSKAENPTHVYAEHGAYTVSVTGVIKGWSFDYSLSAFAARKFKNVTNWGVFKIFNIQTFSNAHYMDVTASDAPEILTDSLYFTFVNCQNLTNIGGQWDVSGVNNFDLMFTGCTLFNQSLDYMDTSSMTSALMMFQGCAAFNQSLNSWDVSNLVDATSMFLRCSAFNGDVSSWDLLSLEKSNAMFADCTSFNVDISSWALPSIKSMGAMFGGCASFNQPIGNWDVSNLWSAPILFNAMQSLLDGATSFDQDLSGLDISGATQLYNFLTNCGISVANYNTTLIGFASQSVSAYVNFGSPPVSPTGAGLAAKNDLINNANWIFS